MPSCEMCGNQTGQLIKSKIEGTELEVCPNCAKFGKPVEEKPMPRYVSGYSPQHRAFAPRTPKPEPRLVIVDDYATLIRNARERLGLNQEEFSKKLNEKQSIMQKIESGSFQPSIEQARRFERTLKIKLVEEEDEGGEVPLAEHSKSGGMTMGDFIKDKRKKE